MKRRDWLTFVLVVLALPATSVRAEQASFDCLKAAAPIEQLICSDPQLLTLDGALGDAFAKYRQRGPEKERAGALAEQRAWLALRLKQCDVPAKGGAELALEVRWRTAPCLNEMYRARLAALGAPADPPQPSLPQLADPGSFTRIACGRLSTRTRGDEDRAAHSARSMHAGQPPHRRHARAIRAAFRRKGPSKVFRPGSPTACSASCRMDGTSRSSGTTPEAPVSFRNCTCCGARRPTGFASSC